MSNSHLSPDDLEHLVLKAQQGGVRAFTKLYDALVGKVYRFVYIKIGNHEDAQDIVAETWKTIWLNLSKYKKGNFQAYLFRIAYTTLISFVRKQKKTYSLDEAIAMPAKQKSVEDMIVQKQAIASVLQELDTLPPLQASIVVLRFVEGFSVKETADILGKPSLVIRVAQHRAIKKLQSVLQNHG